jgi:transposase-like protein
MNRLFCPIPYCPLHDPAVASRFDSWSIRAGFHQTEVVGPVQRYRCRCCRRSFSDRTFGTDYYAKVAIPYAEVLRRISSSESVRATARNLRCSPGSILNRIDRLSRECIARNHTLLEGHELREDLAADGFESFDVSQYFPNNIGLLVGSASQFVYGFSHTTIRRKGSMTATQKRKRVQLEQRYRAPPSGLRDSFAELLSLIPRIWKAEEKPRLTLWTDQNAAYPRAIGRVDGLLQAQSCGSFGHLTIPSRAVRTFTNPLFPVNYLDRELRKDLAAHRRESACFTRNVANGLGRLAVYLFWHNYLKPWRVRTARVQEPSHAVVAGIELAAIQLETRRLAAGERSFLSHLSLDAVELRTWLKAWDTPLGGRGNLPAFARG